MSINDQPDLLFFDTFSHDNSEELNLDLVQFPKSVFVCEIRVIPLGARVQGDFPGGVRLGATNPTQFDIDFFVNDLSKPGACTFQSLGRLEYSQNGTIHMECHTTPDKPQIPTDGLVLRGCYTTLTLAVYGNLTKSTNDKAGPATTQARPPIAQEIATNIPPAREWNPEPDAIAAYSGNEQLEGNYVPDNYDNQIYREDYYEGNEPPKDPRTYHQQDWDNAQLGCDTNTPHDRSRRRSHESRHSSRHRDRSHDSCSREYVVKGEYRRSRTRSRSGDRKTEQDWERSPYKKDEYRRHRDSSYERGGSYERRKSPYDTRAPSYERKYDKRAPSYEPYDKKRVSPYGRVREPSYGGGSPGDDPRKKPRTPSRECSPVMLDDAHVEYDRNGKPRVDFYQSYRHKSSIRSPSQELVTPPYIEPQHPSLVTVQIVESGAAPVKQSPKPNDADLSIDESLEPILSDEDICDDAEGAPYEDSDYDLNDYCDMDDIIKYYNPFKSEWLKYVYKNKIYHLNDASATYEQLAAACADLARMHDIAKCHDKCEDIFLERGNGSREEWVQKCEQLCASVTSVCKDTDIMAAIFANANDRREFGEIANVLVSFTRVGLNLEWALSQHAPTYKLRHMKCGIRLAEALVTHRHNARVVAALLERGLDIPMRLFHLYAQPHVALSIRLMILKALSGYVSSKVAVDDFMRPNVYPTFEKGTDANTPRNGYQVLIDIMQSGPLSRIKYAVSCLIKKLNMYELLEKLNKVVTDLSATSPEPAKEPQLTESEAELVVNSLDELLLTYGTRCFHMSQPKRFLPASAQFHIGNDNTNEPLLLYLSEHRFLEACLCLLTCPATCANMAIVSPIHDLVHELVHSQEGCKFLYDNMKVAELLFRVLVEPCDERNTDDYLYHEAITSHCNFSNYNDIQILGLEMAYKLRAIHLVESISDLQMGSFDENELTDRLQELFTLSYGNVGKLAVPDAIVMDDHVECLLEVLERDLRPKAKGETPSKYRAPAKGYAADLIIAAVKFAARVPFLKKYGARIYSIVKDHDKFEPSVSCSLQELIPYLKPIENANLLSGEDLAECVDILKGSADAAPDLPGEMITCLRILQHHCIPERERTTEEYVELKYKYNVLQLYSHDGQTVICTILDRLTTHYQQPNVHSPCFASTRGVHVALILLPALRLLDDMISRVVKCRGSRFRDLTAAPLLLNTFGLLLAFPAGCVAHRLAAAASAACVRALLAYAQPAADDAAGCDSLKRGPWTSLCAQAIAYATTAPHTFVPGLVALSELLPLPLPMQCKTAPSERELADASNERRLWSAHLYALGDELVEMIQTICVSAYRPVVHLLRRVCVQVADLAPSAAATVARAAAGAAVKAAAAGGAELARVIGFLACLVSHAPVKCAVLHGRSQDVLGVLCDVLSATGGGPENAAAQECASLALVGICDAEISLTPASGDAEAAVANSLPSEEALASVLDATAECLGATKSSAVASSVLRVYFVLTEYEFGFRQFRKSVRKKKECYERFFEWLVESAGDDAMDCLGLFLDLVKVLCSEEGEGALGRKCTLAVDELADLVGYATDKSEHTAITLEAKLKERNADEHVLANASFLSCYLSRPHSPRSPSPPAPAAAVAPLVQQFLSRPVHSDSDQGDVERLASWLTLPDSAADEDGGEDMVLCDILEISRSELSSSEPGWLQAALRELAGLVPTVLDPIVHRPTVCVPENRVLSVCDTFRSRPPNTSRPPSLHVDDFTARQLAPTYNRGVRRGGGGGGTGTDRGRFASTTPHHPLYRQMRGRAAWGDMGAQHFGHFPASYNIIGGMGWGGLRMHRPRHRRF